MQKREKLSNWLLCFRVSSFLVHVCKFREKFTSRGNEEYIKHVWYNAYTLDRHMSRQNVSAKNKETAEQTVQGRSQDFSKEGSHGVKVRVLTRLSLWHFRYGHGHPRTPLAMPLLSLEVLCLAFFLALAKASRAIPRARCKIMATPYYDIANFVPGDLQKQCHHC